jgi:hypothetical protein
VYLGGAFGPTGHCGIRDDGDQEAEEAARSLLPTRRHDMVGTWPSEKLGELIEQRPDLLPELIRRRPSEVSQA